MGGNTKRATKVKMRSGSEFPTLVPAKPFGLDGKNTREGAVNLRKNKNLESAATGIMSDAIRKVVIVVKHDYVCKVLPYIGNVVGLALRRPDPPSVLFIHLGRSGIVAAMKSMRSHRRKGGD
ncbi:hypothetical protein [Plantactinospora sp. KLBMP9567]|uniref:hypothetical protein n=1 Tax=Plantactinospora sp. KLBMP9567 TaxID=3085900 RepID=UPI002980F3F9|nr:hypothetical protein [Plantactinospora sp. KLBMP9567]MDW5329055.1 hypothetical protein [Plantactinospora sp. KLBMP9567]